MKSLSILGFFVSLFSVHAENFDSNQLAARSRKPVTRNACEPCNKTGISCFLDASFLYWHVGEDGLDLATNAVWSEPSLQPFLSTNTKTLYQSFDYQPGFQVGLGIAGAQDWEFFIDYTWLRGTNNLCKDVFSSAPTATAGVDIVPNASGTPVWMTQNWFLQSTSNNQALIGTSLQSQWKYAVDFLDLIASSVFWQKSSVIVRPLVGLRAAAIRQSLRIGLTEFPSFFEPLPLQPIYSRNRSRNIGIGPKIGVDCRIKLYDQLRIEGRGALDCLWTHFAKITHSEDAASTSFNPGPYRAATKNWNCLRTMAEFSLGLGWGTFFSCEKYHMDFSAAYDFVYLWNQNMMRLQLDSILTGNSESAADLMMHGLRIESRFQF